jgi:hypothetical protein
MKVTVCWGDGSGISWHNFWRVHFFVIHFWREAEVSLISGKKEVEKIRLHVNFTR